MLRDVYSGLGTGLWTWQRVSAAPNAFAEWLEENHEKIGGPFGNHRKYETLKPSSNNNTARAVDSFIKLTAPSPSGYFSAIAHTVGNDPQRIFDAAYKGLAIKRFGRLAKFDFLCLLGRLDLAPLEPGSTYLRGATGPLEGALLLIDGNASSVRSIDELEAILQRLDTALMIGMQALEDSLCNWQKSPRKFIHFVG